MHRLGVPAAVWLEVVALAACSPYGGGCSDVGGFDGVSVDLDAVVRAHPAHALTVRVCVDDACRDAVRVSATTATQVVAGDRVVGDDTPVRVEVRVSDARGRVVLSDVVTVTPRRDQPNGPGCEPTLWNAYLAVRDGRLVEAERPTAG